uniref:tRNA pseudouridine(55) synthase TruB n=1 Tax=Gemmiger formicilis TaxID=745368 RepID=UPI0040276004
RGTQAGVCSLGQCHTPPDRVAAAESGARAPSGGVLPIESVFTPLPALHVNSGVKAHLLNGCPTSHYAAADGRYRTYDETGAFLGLASVEGGVLKVEKLFCERG